MHKDVLKILVSEEELKSKVEELGKKITEDYKGSKKLILVGILRGSVVFMSDLMRNIKVDCTIDFMSVSSYGSGTKTSGVVRIVKDLDKNIEGSDVLIVEDILDSGKTLSYLKELLSDRGPASIKIVTLLDKPERREAEVKADYIGFSVPNEFVVGYGLDYNEGYRNLPYVGVLKPEVYSE